jgi:hypothetical protein
MLELSLCTYVILVDLVLYYDRGHEYDSRV